MEVLLTAAAGRGLCQQRAGFINLQSIGGEQKLFSCPVSTRADGRRRMFNVLPDGTDPLAVDLLAARVS